VVWDQFGAQAEPAAATAAHAGPFSSPQLWC